MANVTVNQLTNTYCKLNVANYAALSADQRKGVFFVFRNADGEESAIHFLGTRFQATAKTQDEIIRVMKAVTRMFWAVDKKAASLRERNDSLRPKLTSRCPVEIVIYANDAKKVKTWDVSECEFTFKLFPTAKDRERSTKDVDKYIHGAVLALLEALDFRVEFPAAKDLKDKDNAENAAPTKSTTEQEKKAA